MKNISTAFINSVLNQDKIEPVLEWIQRKSDAIKVNVNKIDFKDAKQWSISNIDLKHDSGRFFKIEGVNVKTNDRLKEWDQPIINQNEIGYLGFIVKNINGVLKFLVQAKVEPGNINFVQLSPSIQATKSNFTKIHEGRSPYYLNYFQNVKRENIIVDQLHSEQGSRFLKKRNRNTIIYVEDEIELYDNFLWLTLGQLNKLIQLNNIVNMDSRTVLSCIQYFNNYQLSEAPFFSLRNKIFLNSYIEGFCMNSIEDILMFVTSQKFKKTLQVTKKKIINLDNWLIEKDQIIHTSKRFFKVIAVEVEIEGREVSSWAQPMIEPLEAGVCVFICKRINDVLHIAIQSKVECGSFDTLELAPSLQTSIIDGKSYSDEEIPFISFFQQKKGIIIHNSFQSEEGGRFYKEQNQNVIIESDDIPTELPENFIWITLSQLNYFTKFNNILNIQTRNLMPLFPYEYE
jgi:oxidase EvaA